MAAIGPHFKFSADPRHRALLKRFFVEVLEANASTPVPHIDSFSLSPESSIGVVYAEGGALTEADQVKAPWLEFLVSDVEACTKKLGAMGVAPLEYHDKANLYFRVPGGPVFRLARQ